MKRHAVAWQSKFNVTNTYFSPICDGWANLPSPSSGVIFPTTLALLLLATVTNGLSGGPHANSAKDHQELSPESLNRLHIMCTTDAHSHINCPIYFERNLNHRNTVTFANHAVEELDDVLLPLQTGRDVLLPLIGLPCSVARLPLSKHAARLQTVRSISLIQSGILYCSSIFGYRNVPIRQLEPGITQSGAAIAAVYRPLVD